MDKYKLVPVEPTASPTSGMNLGQRIQHVGGWESERGTVEFGSVMAVGALVSHILRDIAVQGEPIGWYTEDHLDDKSATTYSVEVAQRWRDKGWPVWPLYTAPQPPEQQLDLHLFAKRMDEELEKHDIQGFEPVVLAVAEEVLGYEQQPAPDDTRLDTDELHKLLMILRSTIGGAMWTLDDEEEELAVRTEKAIEALAVYHKGTKS